VRLCCLPQPADVCTFVGTERNVAQVVSTGHSISEASNFTLLLLDETSRYGYHDKFVVYAEMIKVENQVEKFVSFAQPDIFQTVHLIKNTLPVTYIYNIPSRGMSESQDAIICVDSNKYNILYIIHFPTLIRLSGVGTICFSSCSDKDSAIIFTTGREPDINSALSWSGC
jgi:hypothetical protein